MKTSEVINQIQKCQQLTQTDLTGHYEIAKIIRAAENEKEEYLHTGFQEEAEGEDPQAAPIELLVPIF